MKNYQSLESKHKTERDTTVCASFITTETVKNHK